MFDWLFKWFYRLLYSLVSGMCYLAQQMYQIFEVFAGLKTVDYDSQEGVYLINVFFQHPGINRVYWAMASIGIVLCFAFGIVAIIKKMFDSSDKMQTTLGQIVGSIARSIFIILILNVLMTVVLDATNTLINQIAYSFDKVGSGEYLGRIAFDREDYATMARIYNTIGNYALNTSYNSRYNVNNCFNAIREDMVLLQEKHENMFDFDYSGSSGYDVNWQSVLVPIAHAANINEDIDADGYNEGLNTAMVNAMDVLRTNRSFYPLTSYEKKGENVGENNSTRLDAVLCMGGTMNAALNEDYNKKPFLTDSLRYPYVRGEKDMYDLYGCIEEDFDITKFSYVVVFLTAAYMCWQFFQIAINCVARIFNMLVLYLVAPPFIGATPLDGGGKMKQWTVAFLVQSLSVVGSIVAIKLLLMIIPIVLSDSLVLFSNSTILNFSAKILLIMAAALTASKASGMISGILADSAGWQSVNAGDVGSGALGRLGNGLKAAETIGGGLKSAAKSAISLPKSAVNGLMNLGSGIASAGRGIASAGRGIAGAYRSAKNYFSGGSGSGTSGPKNNSSLGSGSEKKKSAAASTSPKGQNNNNMKKKNEKTNTSKGKTNNGNTQGEKKIGDDTPQNNNNQNSEIGKKQDDDNHVEGSINDGEEKTDPINNNTQQNAEIASALDDVGQVVRSINNGNEQKKFNTSPLNVSSILNAMEKMGDMEPQNPMDSMQRSSSVTRKTPPKQNNTQSGNKKPSGNNNQSSNKKPSGNNNSPQNHGKK
ncbi:MAG: hypothetical protein PUB10_03775 [Clostridiales bacterium]|nr:hypothetical protein [Clostridiales bacterium]